MINKFKQLISRTIRDESSFRFINRSKSMNSSNIWLERQRKDPYVRRAIRESYRARSAFKLIEIDQKYKFLRPGDLVIDIGSTPGSWVQVLVQKTNSGGKDPSKLVGKVIGIDKEYINPIEGAHLLSFSDITDQKTFDKVSRILNESKVHAVVSDMAPNSTGQASFDHDCIINLQKKAFNLARHFLGDNGFFLCKIWFGDTTKEFTNELSKFFQFVKLVKPEASRDDSSEIFVFCSKFINNNNNDKNKIK